MHECILCEHMAVVAVMMGVSGTGIISLWIYENKHEIEMQIYSFVLCFCLDMPDVTWELLVCCKIDRHVLEAFPFMQSHSTKRVVAQCWKVWCQKTFLVKGPNCTRPLHLWCLSLGHDLICWHCCKLMLLLLCLHTKASRVQKSEWDKILLWGLLSAWF